MMGDFPKELVDRFLRKGAAAGAELSPVKSIPLALIDPSPFQSREEFPEAEIRSLADSIAAVGLLSPLVVRPSPADPSRFELVAGERRKRALELLGESHADCSVRDLADVDAAEVALLENLDRENLNAAEASRGLQTLLRLGHDVSTLAALLRIGVDDVAARLQLAELPAFWQAWLRKERDPRRGVAAERLVAWLEFPDVLAAMEPVAARWGNGMTLSAWQRELVDVVLRLSRDMDPQSPVGPCFKVTRELREKLKVVQLRVGDHVEERSMAVELWDTHQDRGNAPPAKRRGSILGTPATNGRSEVGGQRSEVGDSDSPPGDQPLAIADQGPPDDPEKLERWVDGFLRETLHQHIVKMECSELYALAEHVRVDLKAEFKCTRWFTDVFGGKRLLALCDEWGIREEVADARDRGELIAAILALRSRCFLPQCVVDLCRPADADAAL
jgi:ParB/RepB/Spo0J family partition protein